MVLLKLVEGRKGPSDTLVLVWAYGEALSFHELLFILKRYFDSEHSYYPVSQGYLGKGMLLGAIDAVAVGVPIETVLRKFKLYRKGRQLNVIDDRKISEAVSNVVSEKTKLHELM
jgi:hypothetical protein